MTLFDQIPNVRNTDPQTSKDAANSMRPHLNKQRRQVLALIGRFSGSGDEGWTAWELAKQLPYQQSVIARRLTDLHELGFIDQRGTRPGSTGRQLRVWFITDKGRAAL